MPRKRSRYSPDPEFGGLNGILYVSACNFSRCRYNVLKVGIENSRFQGNFADEVENIWANESKVYEMHAALGPKVYAVSCGLDFDWQITSFDVTTGCYTQLMWPKSHSDLITYSGHFHLIPAFGKLYIIKGFTFHCFDPNTNLVEPLCLASLASMVRFPSVEGYVVIDRSGTIDSCGMVDTPSTHVILFLLSCVNDDYDSRTHYCFCGFDVVAKQWFCVDVSDLSTEEICSNLRYHPLKPYSCEFGEDTIGTVESVKEEIRENKVYPFDGKAELVGDVIVGVILHTIVAYRLDVQSSSSSSNDGQSKWCVQLIGLYQEDPEVGDFRLLPAFTKAPFGSPSRIGSKLIHLCGSYFCFVEIADEPCFWRNETQPVYFILFSMSEGKLRVFDSTVRLIDISMKKNKRHPPPYDSVGCGFFLHEDHDAAFPARGNQRGRSAVLSDTFKHEVKERIRTFPQLFFRLYPHVNSCAYMLLLRLGWVQSNGLALVQKKACDTWWRLFIDAMANICFDGPDVDLTMLLHETKPAPPNFVLRCPPVLLVCRIRNGFYLYIYNIGCPSNEMGPYFELLECKEIDAFGMGSFIGWDETLFLPSNYDSSMSTVSGYYEVNVQKRKVTRVTHKAKTKPDSLICSFLSQLFRSHDDYSSSEGLYDSATAEWGSSDSNPVNWMRGLGGTITGYATISRSSHTTLILFCVESVDGHSHEFHCIDVVRKQRVDVKVKPGVGELRGKCEYVDDDSCIYMYSEGKISKFPLKFHERWLCLHREKVLGELESRSPPIPFPSREHNIGCIIQLGQKLLCAIETCNAPLSRTHQYICIIVFDVSKSGKLSLHHSAVAVLDNKGSLITNISGCIPNKIDIEDASHK